MSVSLKTGDGDKVEKKVKVERPRPLSQEELLVVVENVSRSLAVEVVGQQAAAAQTNFDLSSQLEVLTANLKISGPALERSHKVNTRLQCDDIIC